MKRFKSLSPHDNAVLGTIDISTSEEVRAAVEAARRASKGWQEAGVTGRAPHIRRFVELWSKRAEEFAELTSKEMGMPLTQAKGEVQEALLYGRGGKARGFAGMIANLSHGDEFMSAEISRGMVHNFNTHQGMSARQLEAVQHILQRQGVPEGRQGEIMNAAQGYSRSGAAADANKLADLLGRTEGAIALRPGAGKVAAGDVVQQLIEGLGPIVKDLKDVKLRGGDPGPWSMTNTGGR